MLLFVTISLCVSAAYAAVETSTTSINLTDTGDYVDQLTALEAKLVQNYNRNVRPVKNDSTRTMVKFYTVIQHIEEVDEIEQAMTVHGFMYWEWNDEYMVWDKNAYNGVDRFTLHGWYVWKPDIVLYNTGAGVENGRQVNQYQHVWIQSDGSTFYFPFFSFRATCIFDFTDYPYDVQLCPMIMGSWSYTLKEMEIMPSSAQAGVVLAWNASKTVVSGWELASTRLNVTYWNALNKARADVKPPEAQFQQSFTEINVWLQLRRHAPYFGIVVLLPAVATSFFTLASFWTVSATQGVAVLLVNLIAQAVFTDDLLRKIPPNTGGTPRIVRYYAFNLTCTVLAVILLMLLKSLENLGVDSAAAVPASLASAVRASDSVRGAVGDRLGFRSRVNEARTNEHAVDESAANDDEEDEANRQHGTVAERATASSSGASVAWSGVADLLKKICFALYLVVYLALMFAWLC